MTPLGGFAFGVALNVACCLPGAVYYAAALIGVGWFFGAVWSLLNLVQSLRTRDLWGIALGAVGMVLCFTPGLWFAGKTSAT
jgi:hypothetical protein